MTVPLGLPGLSIQRGDHICAFHRGPSARQDILTSYLRVGLSSGDKCICVLDSTDTEVLRAALRDALAGASQPDDRPLEIYRSQEAYLAGGAFSIAAMLAFWEEKIGPAIAGGYRLARAAGEMTWSVRQMPGVTDLVIYEAELNRFMPRYPQVILCLYDLEVTSGELLVDMLKTHPRVLIRGIVWDNPYYVEPAEFLAARH
jgi:hypothetical protein